jgi:hypothetical protein
MCERRRLSGGRGINVATADLMKLKTFTFKFGAWALGLLCLAEIAARVSGITDFPVYARDPQIGYIVRPNQSGKFLDKNAWVFNNRSMPTERVWGVETGGKPNVMLIGNSVVMGGNPLDQKDKLGPLFAADMGSAYSVWPIGIGGWTTVNEMVYLDRNPDVVNATHFFVWEYMRGGLSETSAWRGEYVFPTQRPLSAGWFALRRYVLPLVFDMDTNELPPTGALESDHLADFRKSIAAMARASGLKRPGLLFLYPELKSLRQARNSVEWLPERKEIENLCREFNLDLVDVAQDPRWNESLYRDGTHPSPQGNVVLAHILADAAKGALASDTR